MDLLALVPDLVKMTIALFIVVDPLGSVPIFVGLTKDMDTSQRKKLTS
jgi:small neutral amino acid transporter SnatA (MarC family)